MFFKKKKTYIIEWKRGIHLRDEYLETVVIAKSESDASYKFLSCHNAKLEKIEILHIRECVAIW